MLIKLFIGIEAVVAMGLVGASSNNGGLLFGKLFDGEAAATFGKLLGLDAIRLGPLAAVGGNWANDGLTVPEFGGVGNWPVACNARQAVQAAAVATISNL